jgi:hypothetical protein
MMEVATALSSCMLMTPLFLTQLPSLQLDGATLELLPPALEDDGSTLEEEMSLTPPAFVSDDVVVTPLAKSTDRASIRLDVMRGSSRDCVIFRSKWLFGRRLKRLKRKPPLERNLK